MKIVVVGVGGLGGYIGGRMAQSGQDVTFIARGQRLAALRQNGPQVRSPDGNFVIQPVQATDNPAEMGSVDLILFCVKTYDLLSAAEPLRLLLGLTTALLPVQNGIAHIEPLRTLLGKPVVLGGVGMISADLERGRRLEIEAWNGAIVRYGKEVGIPTPVNRVIYACLRPYANGAQAT
jgi:2-dehydropantoate 2-reductase